jgi:4-diphosphocytidyl-2-C-methyl-D-erythritol kinase
MQFMQFMAPAKINLSFRILGRREDGLHEVETLMAPISLCDELSIERCDGDPGIHFSCDEPSLSSADDNLVVKAAKLFFETIKRGPGARIHLAKKIPHGAGLGGGSSNAATTLLALNQIFEANLSSEALARMAAQIGSDVPFFIYESAAICRGRGEIVEAISLSQKLPLLLLKPEFGVPTPWAYGRWKDARELPGVSYAPQKVGELTFVNDLEQPVFEKFVFLAQLKMWLLEQPEVTIALLSGSGSTVFAVMRGSGEAHALTQRAREQLDPNLWTCPCETL